MFRFPFFHKKDESVTPLPHKACDILLSEQLFAKYTQDIPNQSVEEITLLFAKLLKQALREISDCDGFCKLEVVYQDINPKYSFINNTITIPYKKDYSGIDYYRILKHEFTHAQQAHTIRENKNDISTKMAKISLYLYPRTTDATGNDKDYLNNYLELQARTEEARALREVSIAYHNLPATSLSLNDCAICLKSIEKFVRDIELQHSLDNLEIYFEDTENAFPSHYDYFHALKGIGESYALSFWKEHSRFMLISAFNELQDEYNLLLKEQKILIHILENKDVPTSTYEEEPDGEEQFNLVLQKIEECNMRLATSFPFTGTPPEPTYKFADCKTILQFLDNEGQSMSNTTVYVNNTQKNNPSFFVWSAKQISNTTIIEDSFDNMEFVDTQMQEYIEADDHDEDER